MKYRPEEIERLDKQMVWHPFTQMQDYLREQNLIIERGEGCYLIDIYGKKYIDGVSSLWVNIHGHGHPKLKASLKDQVDRLCHATLLGQSTLPSTLFAKKLLEFVPENLTKVFFSDNGATSVEIALKMAYQYFRNLEDKNLKFKKRRRFVNLANAYHGDTLGSVSIGGIELFHAVFKDLVFEPLTIQNFSVEQAEQIFKQQGEEIVACVVEPMIQGAAGMRLMPNNFLSFLRKLCDRYGVFLICDEVATGFGRTGKMFAIEHEGVKPDFLCLAKGITGGYLPLAATLTTESVFQAFCGDYRDFKTFFHGHSYTGNPLACAAALANLQIFEEEQVLTHLQPKIKFLTEALIKFQKHPHVKEVRQLGFMVGIELDSYPIEQKMGHQVVLAARKRGIIIRPLGNTLVLMPPLAIDLPTLQMLVQGVYDAMDEVT
ncbi:MAG: adenosylmethionine--8-amino-7-oxononanoate transaminase [Deltaproteobacteria bacterium]|nr:adenosylmethionine--8-amino-7-oxononanoate transaminase [Deltaproteobacteria bacterium]